MQSLILATIIADVLFSLCAAFYAVTETLKAGNDQGDSTGDRFYYIVDFEITRELDNVTPDFDPGCLGTPYGK